MILYQQLVWFIVKSAMHVSPLHGHSVQPCTGWPGISWLTNAGVACVNMSLHSTMECQQCLWSAVGFCCPSWWIIQCQLYCLCLCMTNVFVVLYHYACWLNPIAFFIYLLLMNCYFNGHTSFGICNLQWHFNHGWDDLRSICPDACGGL